MLNKFSSLIKNKLHQLPAFQNKAGSQFNLVEGEKKDKCRYFAIYTAGHSGSLWLAKFFNSHPDVLCWHEGVLQRAFPIRYWQIKDKERLLWFRSIRHPNSNHYRKAYQAIGDVGSLTPQIITHPEIKENFLLYGLIRNGILFVRSQLMAYQEFDAIPWQLQQKMDNYIGAAKKKHPELDDFDDKTPEIHNFIFSCWRWCYFIEIAEKATRKIYKIEDLNNPHQAKEMFITVTGLTDFPPQVIKSMVGKRINPHTKGKESYDPRQVYEKWDQRKRQIFVSVCGDMMKKYYDWPLK